MCKSVSHRMMFRLICRWPPYIVELRNKGDKKDVSELENCFDALYGVMLLRLQHKPISDETAKAVADITKLLAMLSDYYKQDKAGELKFE